MRTSIFLGTALSVLLATGIASAAKTTYTATLNGATENPPNNLVLGTGTATMTYDSDTKRLCGEISFALLSGPVTAAHIHKAQPGQPTSNGNPWVTLTAGTTPIKINATLNPTQQAEIADTTTNPLYANLHTGTYPNGEIRGNFTVGGTEQTCDPLPDGGADAGADGGSDAGADGGSSGSSGSSGTSGNTSSGTSGVSTTPSGDSGTTTTPASSSGEDDGCSTTGSSPTGNGLAIGLGAMIAIGFVARARKRAKR